MKNLVKMHNVKENVPQSGKIDIYGVFNAVTILREIRKEGFWNLNRYQRQVICLFVTRFM